ncbi:glycosyltransferase [Candidatus Saccharibacteria bacterium]|nr:MAG: glycosyltransferase [Candidatus Saccharibacteria bacterium]
MIKSSRGVSMKLVVVSICKNEAETIAELVKRIPKKYDGISELDICIVDDGSTDGTAEKAKIWRYRLQ